MAKFQTFIYPILDGVETEVGVTVDYDASYDPGRLSGPPENCYPPDSEMTINSVIPDTPDWPRTIAEEIEAVKDRIEEEAWEHYHRHRDDQNEDRPEPDPEEEY